MVKIVVTDDQGRYVMPDLPKANYTVWVRGYGLVDSPKVQHDARQDRQPDRGAGAERGRGGGVLSADLLAFDAQDSGEERIPRHRHTDGNGINPKIKSQTQFLREFKTDGCFHCHAIGTKATRTHLAGARRVQVRATRPGLRRIQSGQASKDMVETIERFGTERGAEDARRLDRPDRRRRAAGARSRRARKGLERNVVITVWDWADPKTYLHDEIATDKRNPTVNAYGSLYGATENSTDIVPILDPVKSIATTVKLPVRDPKTPSAINAVQMFAPSRMWGDEKLWNAQTIPHSLMLDEKARVWYAARIRAPNNPGLSARRAPTIRRRKLFPITTSNRQVSMLDPATKKFTLVDTCFPTHHVQFGFDANRTLWTSSGGIGADVLGWVNTKMLEETGDEAKSQGWTPFILDTNGNGKRDEGYVEPNQPVDPTKDKRIRVGFYSIAPSPGRRLDLGHGDRLSRARWCGSIPARTRRQRRLRKSTRCRCRATRRAAATSTARASCGRRSRAAISARSTAASAKARSTARTPPASIARKAGRSIRCRDRSSAT